MTGGQELSPGSTRRAGRLLLLRSILAFATAAYMQAACGDHLPHQGTVQPADGEAEEAYDAYEDASSEVSDIVSMDSFRRDCLGLQVEVRLDSAILDDRGDIERDGESRARPCGVLPECPLDFVCTPLGTCLSPDGAGAYVPAGSFWMGCNEALSPSCYGFDLPAFHEQVAAFVIDRTEVTAGAYATCEAAGLCPVVTDESCTPGSSSTTVGKPGYEDRPATCACHESATAFCASLGKRLCTEPEWEMAARGSCDLVVGDCRTSMRTYPWGESPPTCTTAWIDGCSELLADLPKHSVMHAVGLLPSGASPYGALDMAGNAEEWVRDCWRTYPGGPPDWEHPAAEDPLCDSTGMAVVRGGDVFAWPADCTTTARTYDHYGNYNRSFRCCYSMSESESTALR